MQVFLKQPLTNVVFDSNFAEEGQYSCFSFSHVFLQGLGLVIVFWLPITLFTCGECGRTGWMLAGLI